MGIALADRAAELGAGVDLVLGPVPVRPKNSSIRITSVTDAASMASACISIFPKCQIAVLSAAVADYTPVTVEGKKMKKTGEEFSLQLKPTTDIAAELGRMKKKSQLVAGFALETDNEIGNARLKLKEKNLDIIVLNSLSEKGAGFEVDTNRITIIDRNNNIDKFELKSKDEAAADILDKIISMIR
jgi:phosphopantothenoylcysteine decarboxylase/phosphopantothenate--cysteine ligase